MAEQSTSVLRNYVETMSGRLSFLVGFPGKTLASLEGFGDAKGAAPRGKTWQPTYLA